MKHNEQLGISNDLIQQIALDNGFQLKDQPDGTKDLHPYVYNFARSLVRITRPNVSLPHAVKINVASNPPDYDVVQSSLFSAGGTWNSGRTDYFVDYMPYLYISEYGTLTQGDNLDWFEDYEAKEVTLQELITLLENGQSLRNKQKSITEWSDQTFGDKSPLQIATRMNNEVAELLTGLANKPDAIEHHAGECADVLIMLLQVAEKLGVDIEAELDRKMHVNRNRKWAVNAAGKAQHV